VSAPGGNPGRLAALIALLAAAFVAVALGILLMRHAVTLLFVVAAVAVAAAAAWLALTRRGAVRVVAEVIVVAALIGGAVVMIARGAVDELVVFVIAGGVFGWAARNALRAAAPSAEVIGMAGGDGSQALVAQVAMERGYAEIVQSDAYRDDKLKTVEKMLPELLGPRATHSIFAFAGQTAPSSVRPSCSSSRTTRMSSIASPAPARDRALTPAGSAS